MAIGAYLDISVTRARETFAPDNMGGGSVSTATTTIRAAMWQGGGPETYAASKFQKVSSHQLVCKYDADILENDKIVYDSVTYRVVSRPDNVMGKNELLVVGLERLEQ